MRVLFKNETLKVHKNEQRTRLMLKIDKELLKLDGQKCKIIEMRFDDQNSRA